MKIFKLSTKLPSTLETYKSIRKPMPPASHPFKTPNSTKQIRQQNPINDLPTLDDLMNDANIMAQENEHMLDNWFVLIPNQSASNNCLLCGKTLMVNTLPLTNTLNIDGPIINSKCINN